MNAGQHNLNFKPRWNLAAALARFLSEQRIRAVLSLSLRIHHAVLGLVAPDRRNLSPMAGATRDGSVAGRIIEALFCRVVRRTPKKKSGKPHRVRPIGRLEQSNQRVTKKVARGPPVSSVLYLLGAFGEGRSKWRGCYWPLSRLLSSLQMPLSMPKIGLGTSA